MTLLIVSFLAGVLTVAAPCILPLLPVIVGGSIVSNGAKSQNSWLRPATIATGLAISVIVFTLILKATTVLLGVPQIVWNTLSGVIVIMFGLSLLLPSIWEKFILKTGLQTKTNKLLGASSQKSGITRDLLMGAALGPVFSSCSPTYALIVAAILPASFTQGLAYLTAYALGLAATLMVIAFAGQSITRRLGWAANPDGPFKRIIGAIFIVVGVFVILGLDRDFQAYVLEQGWYDPIMKLEQSLGVE